MKRREFVRTVPLTELLVAGLATTQVVYAPAANAETAKVTEGTSSRGVIFVDDKVLQEVIDSAPPYSVIICNRNQQIVVDTSIVLSKPVTLLGLNARLREYVGGTTLLIGNSEDITIREFLLVGNADTVVSEARASLMRIQAGSFDISKGRFENSSRNGMEITPAFGKTIIGGTVRDIVGTMCTRDVVSVEGGAGQNESVVRDILIENITAYNSPLRGAVEVSDGTRNISVHRISAINCVYALDLQDHGEPGQTNRDVVVDEVYAKNCEHAIRSANDELGHSNLTLSNITALRCEDPVEISNTPHMTLRNVRIVEHRGRGPAVRVTECDGSIIKDVTVTDTRSRKEALLIKNCNDVSVADVRLLPGTDRLARAVTYKLTQDKLFRNLTISSVSAPAVRRTGIVLEKDTDGAALDNYIVTNNIATVSDEFDGNNALITNNIP